MVRPLISKVIEKHLEINTYDSEVVVSFKQTVVSQLKVRFKLDNLTDIISSRQLASFLDPRYKDLEHEEIEIRENIRCKVQNLLVEMNTSENKMENEVCIQKKKGAFEFLHCDEIHDFNDVSTQFQCYLAEPQLK